MQDKMIVNDIEVSVKGRGNVTHISLTDIAKKKNPENPADVINKWMTNKDAFDFYCLWEILFNPDFNLAESREIKINEVGYNAFTMSPSKWKKRTNAIGIIPSAGKYSVGTYAHPDIALEFASWIDAPFKLYLIREFQKLKTEQAKSLDWSVKRELTKVNFHIYTDAVKENLIVPTLTEQQKKFVYTDETDLMNVAVFGMTAKQWRDKNPDKDGNMRDYAPPEHLLVLSNLESFNAYLINQKIPQHERIVEINNMARQQLQSIFEVNNRLLLPKGK